LQAAKWGFSKNEADDLKERFSEWLYCDRVLQKSGIIQKRKGVNFAADPGHSQVRGTYDEQLQTVNEDHCDGPVFPLRDAPEVILSLQKKLTAYLRTVPGYETRTVNFISAVYYADHTVQIDWHKHSEDNAIDSPVMIVSTGQARCFHLGLINKSNPPNPTVRWAKMAEHGSLIYMPASFNDTHWHAVLPEDHPCGPRISFVTKLLVKPRVFSLKAGRGHYPKFAAYVGCRYPGVKEQPDDARIVRPGTIYGNDYEPFKGHCKPIAHSEVVFQAYAEERMQDLAFRAQALKDLRGKHLLCFCFQPPHPQASHFCHARVWLDIVNRPEYASQG
jgi:hypothetical protein